MKTSQVYKYLRKNSTLEYLLENTYIFAWESDVFGISKSGYINEIEIKTSRSDFLADFKKVKKHLILKCAYNKKEYAVLRKRLHYEYTIKETSLNRATWKRECTGKILTRTSTTNDLKAPKKYNGVEFESVKELYSEIGFVKIFAPHRFYYACPKDMIKKEEIPNYAGLYYILESGELKTIKRAPLIHKMKYDLTKILLHKFYHKTINLQIDNFNLKSQLAYLNNSELEGSLIDKVENMNIQKMLEFY